jgi:hypothetical protein
MTKQTVCVLILLGRVLSAAEEQWEVSSHGLDVPFRSWEAEGARAGAKALVLVPGCKGMIRRNNEPPRRQVRQGWKILN